MTRPINTEGLEPVGPVGGYMPRVKGACPGCGAQALFLASGGYVTCQNLNCRVPDAATDLLEGGSDYRSVLKDLCTGPHHPETYLAKGEAIAAGLRLLGDG